MDDWSDRNHLGLGSPALWARRRYLRIRLGICGSGEDGVVLAGLAIACSLALLAVDKTSEVAFENLKGSTQRILQGSSVLMIIVTVMGYLKPS